ncbi:MAG: agmatinase [Limisphaerales bacterium]|jgi:agmatinase
MENSNQSSDQANSNPSNAFDPEGPGLVNTGIFGLPYGFNEAELVILPIPWDITSSYGSGSAYGPEAIYKASRQVDLMDSDFPEAWKKGIFMLEISKHWQMTNRTMRPSVREYLRLLESGADLSASAIPRQINEISEELRKWVFDQTKQLFQAEKIPAILGGEHSVILGALQAALQKHPEMGMLHLDAHADLRISYEGFTHSHASIMHNLLEHGLKSLVQVGIRDYSPGELNYISKDKRINTFFQSDLDRKSYEGISWKAQVDQIVTALPQTVWVSLDIDVLDPSLCPNTGTPVPGGLDFGKTCYLLSEVIKTGKKLIGFDLVEIAPPTNSNNNMSSTNIRDEWDANVGSRILFKLCSLAIGSKALG